MINSGYERNPQDFYATREWLTELGIRNWLDIIKDGSVVWEPACGDGRMAKVLERHYKTYASDLMYRGWGLGGHDFLTHDLFYHDNTAIITNPPYGDTAQKFIEHALNLTYPVGGQVAMLLRNEYDCGVTRMHLFQDHCVYRRKIVSCTRPLWVDEKPKSGPRHNYAWYVWDWKNPAPYTHEIVYDKRID